MRFLETDREKELLDNAKRSLDDCLGKVKAGEYQESLRTLLIGIDVLAHLKARVSGQVTTEKEAERNNRKRFIAFLREEILGWKEHEIQWEGKIIQVDLSELSYTIRCKQLHEYSNPSSAHYPIRVEWTHRAHNDPVMQICGSTNTRNVEWVEVNGFFLLQSLVTVAQKYIGIFSSTPTQVGCRINPHAVYEILGTVER